MHSNGMLFDRYFCQLEDGPERAAKSLKAVNEDINNKVSLWRGNSEHITKVLCS